MLSIFVVVTRYCVLNHLFWCIWFLFSLHQGKAKPAGKRKPSNKNKEARRPQPSEKSAAGNVAGEKGHGQAKKINSVAKVGPKVNKKRPEGDSNKPNSGTKLTPKPSGDDLKDASKQSGPVSRISLKMYGRRNRRIGSTGR